MASNAQFIKTIVELAEAENRAEAAEFIAALTLAELATAKDIIVQLVTQLREVEVENFVLNLMLTMVTEQLEAYQAKEAEEDWKNQEKARLAGKMPNRNWVTDSVTFVVDGVNMRLAPQTWERVTHITSDGVHTDTWTGKALVVFTLPVVGEVVVQADVQRVETYRSGVIDVKQSATFVVTAGLNSRVWYELTADQWRNEDGLVYGISWVEGKSCKHCSFCNQFHHQYDDQSVAVAYSD